MCSELKTRMPPPAEVTACPHRLHLREAKEDKKTSGAAGGATCQRAAGPSLDKVTFPSDTPPSSCHGAALQLPHLCSSTRRPPAAPAISTTSPPTTTSTGHINTLRPPRILIQKLQEETAPQLCPFTGWTSHSKCF